MPETTELLAIGRDAVKQRDWPRAYNALKSAHDAGPLLAEDTYVFGDAAWWLGYFRESRALYEEAFNLYEAESQPRKAAMAGLALAGSYFMRGEPAIGSGWMGRAMRLLSELPEGVEHAYILFMEFEGALSGHDYETAYAKAKALQEAGTHFGEPNLRALGITGEGRVRLKQGRAAEGIALLDEAMLLAVSGGLAPEWAGNIYCTLMVACNELADYQRAAEWTRATQQWCEGLGAAGPFTGVCRVHRAQVLRLQGSWEEAARQAMLVVEEIGDFDVATVAESYYELGEVKRHAGEMEEAEAAYLQAHTMGRDPQPGLALLRSGRTRGGPVMASLQFALTSEPHDRLKRAKLCAAVCEIASYSDDGELAQQALEELTETAELYGTPGLRALAFQSRARFEIAHFRQEAAIPLLKQAALLWQQLGAPYEVARTRVLLARAYDGCLQDYAYEAAMERKAARDVFERLGAKHDLLMMTVLSGTNARPGGLSEREVEVLALVAKGRSNREIAAELVISEKTVARHLSNILTKLGLPSRTAATAFAFQHGLATPASG